MYLSVVAPCLNEEDGLEEFYLRLHNTLKISHIKEYEIILIDDGSDDRTWETIAYLNERDSRVKGIQLSRNFGHQAALTAGLDVAKGDYIFIIDSDLQDPPELLPDMLEKMKTGFDVVYGQRRQRQGETKFKLVTASMFYRMLSILSDIDIPKDTGDFRLINKKVLKAYQSITESQRFTRGLIAWLGFRQTALSYDRHPRFAGTTKYPLMKMINFSLDAVTGFSLKPLRLIIYLGVFISGISVLTFMYSVYTWYLSNSVPGWASIMTVVCLLSSMQLICLGVIGEYVGRIFAETKKRPLYLVQTKSEEEMPASLKIELIKNQFDISKQTDESTFH
jgi:glycosyltransferase involved in cell wall biosynthesis